MEFCSWTVVPAGQDWRQPGRKPAVELGVWMQVPGSPPVRHFFFFFFKFAVWSNSEKQILYINACIGNPEKWYWWIYFQGRHEDKDIRNGLVSTVGEGKDGTNGDTHTLSWENRRLVGSCCVTQGAQLCALWQPRQVGWGTWERSSKARGYTYTDSWSMRLYGRN